MIIVNNNKCNSCGLCVQICHEYCIEQNNESIEINYGYCSTCTQCIAVCPSQALTWDNFEPAAFDKEQLPSSSQLDELLKQRRTVRDFKKEKIDRELLNEIADYANYAPTHNFNMRLIIVDDDSFIEQIDKELYSFNKRLYRYIFKPEIIHTIIKIFTPDREFEYSKAKPKLEMSLKTGKAIRSFPAALLFIIADQRIPLSLESAQFALYNINLYALTKGIACRNMVGNQMFLNRSKVIWNLLGLQKHEKIFGTMALGHPAVKFSNKVAGKKMPVQWNGKESN
jgi:nitroreductase/NAD-dependent dihydropyrimidine dehydrogenase PreA subunit